MDMEWNQAMSAQAAVFNKLPIHLRGEIIQIGAVKLTDDLQPGEEFQVDVKPVYFRRMHYKVEKLTGFDKERLEHGIGFHVDGFWAALFGSIIISVVGAILGGLLGSGKKQDSQR